MPVYQTYYSLSKKVETCTIRLTGPETIETVNMVVGINTGIGFPPFVSRRILPTPSRDRRSPVWRQGDFGSRPRAGPRHRLPGPSRLERYTRDPYHSGASGFAVDRKP